MLVEGREAHHMCGLDIKIIFSFSILFWSLKIISQDLLLTINNSSHIMK